jgi:putative acetyltransferase
MQIRPAQSEDRDALLDIWLRSVRVTHRFLAEADIQSLLANARDRWLVGLEVWVLTQDDHPIGFMGMSDHKIEALFLAPEYLRRGGGRLLVEHAASGHSTLLVDVNEQNPEARRFYEAMGFVIEGRSEVDRQGRPFPLLHMRRNIGEGKMDIQN